MLVAGVDVISTVNIQHLESLNDAIAELTDVRVRETFPDTVLEDADEVVLVDLSPRGAAGAAARGQGLLARARRGGARQLLPRRSPVGAARARAPRGGRGRRRAPAGAPSSIRSARTAVAERVLALVTPEPRSQRILRRAWRSAERLGAPLDALWVHRAGHDLTRGRADPARGAPAARDRPRGALPRGRGRARADRAARRRRAWLDLRARRHAGREPPARDPARLARLGARARAPGRRHPRRREPRRSPGRSE